MNIGFEAKRFFTNYTGLGNYCRFVIDSLSRYQPQHKYFLYTPKASDHAEVVPIVHRENVEVIHPHGMYAKPLLSAVWRSWRMTGHKTIQSLSVFHGLSQELPIGLPRHVKKVVTIHDLIFLRYPHLYNAIDVKIYTSKAIRACQEADRIIAISEQTAEDIRYFLKIDPSKIQVVYQGCHPVFKKRVPPAELISIRLRYNLPDRYILNVGTIEERKNLVVLIRAMAEIPEKERVPVVIVGRQTAYFKVIEEEIKKNNLSPFIIFLNQVPFADLPAIYQAATVFVYPSLFEGFGIPLIEAIESGIPVITSKGSCFSEAAGPDALYVDPHNALDLSKHLVRVLSDASLRSTMVERSRGFIRKFEPDVIAGELQQVYQSLL
jgi:glycosyltransferase involved in cell wall biosynthesis